MKLHNNRHIRIIVVCLAKCQYQHVLGEVAHLARHVVGETLVVNISSETSLS